MKHYHHWRLENAPDAIAWLYFDKEHATVNTMDAEVMEELSLILDFVATHPDYKGLVIASAKKQGFIAGADIAQFDQFEDATEAARLLRQGQQIFQKIENLKIPTVAMIKGFCLGGGLELALSCRYRVAEEGIKTRLGLPEVKLGIHPGWGGTVRLPRLIGLFPAMNLMLGGHLLSAKAALKCGLVDAVVPERHLVGAATYYASQTAAPRPFSKINQLLNISKVRSVVASGLRKKVRAKASPQHYPAPFQLIDNWEELGLMDPTCFQQEAETCGKLFFTDASRNLVRAFFLQERLKGLAKQSTFSPEHIHVIGAGTMGGDIAAWCALSGMRVTLQDREAKFIAPAIARAFTLFKEKLKEPHLIQKAMDRLMPDPEGLGVSKADVIIEAIFENLDAKQALFKSLEQHAKPNAILATNTSSIPLDEINTVMESPQRLVGIHFFNPVAKMLLIEIVEGERTAGTVTDKAIAFARKIDKLPLPVKSSPGFLVNRILMPYLLESVAMLDEGIPAEAIDKAMTDFGMPMGPITLADVVGLDICLSVAEHLGKYFDAPIPDQLLRLVGEKKLGKKTGEGFYRYSKSGAQIKPKQSAPFQKPLSTLSDRLVARLLEESEKCLAEGVVTDTDLLDAGMIFGTGFAPFRGGPMHYLKSK